MNTKFALFAGIALLLVVSAIAGRFLASSSATAAAQTGERIRLERVPDGGIQPQVVARDGVVHLLYFKGDPAGGDLFYTRSNDEGATWSLALRVNSQARSAIAMGTIRGGHLAVGRKGRVFVEWNGSDVAPRSSAAPTSQRKFGAAPLLFSRLNDEGNAFEPQRNLLTKTWNLDGGGGIAADNQGHVYLAWHANDQEGQDEGGRRVFLAVSQDDGATFTPEKPLWTEPTGACGCCAIGINAQDGGHVEVLYRSATQEVHRDTYFVSSEDGGSSFHGTKLASWNVAMCPMSSYALATQGQRQLAAWESEKKVYVSPLNTQGQATQIQEAAPEGDNAKYPDVRVNTEGQTLLLWTQNTSWGHGGDAAWELFGAQMRPLESANGQQSGVPAWSFATAFARRDGNFTVLY